MKTKTKEEPKPLEFKPEWADGMDGEKYIPGIVQSMTQTGELEMGMDSAGKIIDRTLATICTNNDSLLVAIRDLDYIIKELQVARENMNKEAEDEPSEPI